MKLKGKLRAIVGSLALAVILTGCSTFEPVHVGFTVQAVVHRSVTYALGVLERTPGWGEGRVAQVVASNVVDYDYLEAQYILKYPDKLHYQLTLANRYRSGWPNCLALQIWPGASISTRTGGCKYDRRGEPTPSVPRCSFPFIDCWAV